LIPTKFEVYLYLLRGYEKRYKMWKMRWFGVVRVDHSRLLKIAPFDRACVGAY